MAYDDTHWAEYYQKIQGRAPRQLLLDALDKFPAEAAHHAIDLGCGDGTESVILLSRGWRVLAVDAAPDAIKRLLAKVPPEDRTRLQTQIARFEEVALPLTDLIHASYSIPFCHPDQFPAVWQKIAAAIQPSGRFAGQFFGVRDSWAGDKDMTIHTEEQVHAMLKNFMIESFHEQDEDGSATSGPKHWHVFTVIAKKLRSAAKFTLFELGILATGTFKK